MSLAIGLLDLYCEKCVPKLARLFLAAIILAILYGFTFGIVRFPAPLEVKSYWTKSDYPPGTDIFGIKWASGMSELRVTIHNPTNRDYEDLDLSIRTNEAVVKVVQVTSIQCVPVSDVAFAVHDTQSNVYHDLARIGPRRFRCDKLPTGATLDFLFAVGNLDDLMRAHKSIPNGFFGPKRKPQGVILNSTYRVTYRPHVVAEKVDVGDG